MIRLSKLIITGFAKSLPACYTKHCTKTYWHEAGG
jgi:hypothetical protein